MLTFNATNSKWSVKTDQQDRSETSRVLLGYRFIEDEECEIPISLASVQPVVDGLRIAAKGSPETINVTIQDDDIGYEQLSLVRVGPIVRLRYLSLATFIQDGKHVEDVNCDFLTDLAVRDAKMLARDLETAADTIDASLDGNEARFLPDDPMGHPRVREVFSNVTRMMMRSA